MKTPSPTDPSDAAATGSPTEMAAGATSTPPAMIAHVRAKGWALHLLALLATIFALSFAQKFLIPLVFSVFIAYTLNPFVNTLQHWRIPRVLGTSLLMLGIVSALLMNVNSLVAEFDSILLQAPEVTRKLSAELTKRNDGEANLMQKVQVAASEIENATGQASGQPPPSKKQLVVESHSFNLREWLLVGSMSVFGMIGQTVMVVFLVFFLLISGDKFKRKLVKLTPTLANKKITVRVLSEVNTSIQRYLFMLLVTNVLVGLLSWAAFRLLGLENAGAWGFAAGFLHIIPYFGPVIVGLITALAGFMQFGTFSMALIVGGSAMAIASLVGTFIATWMTGRIAKMNAAAIFIGLLFWGWLWGTWGLLLGVPIIVVIKVVSEHVEGMETIAELLGD